MSTRGRGKLVSERFQTKQAKSEFCWNLAGSAAMRDDVKWLDQSGTKPGFGLGPAKATVWSPWVKPTFVPSFPPLPLSYFQGRNMHFDLAENCFLFSSLAAVTCSMISFHAAAFLKHKAAFARSKSFFFPSWQNTAQYKVLFIFIFVLFSAILLYG